MLTRRAAPTALTLLIALRAVSAEAVEVRQGASPPSYHSAMTQAYAPCLAPNDVTPNGIPACNPPVTSACSFFIARVDVANEFISQRISAAIEGLFGPPLCMTGDYFLDVTFRMSGDSTACTSGHCTFTDRVVRLPFDRNNHNPPREVREQPLDALLPAEVGGPSYQIIDATIIAPDGLPLARTAASWNASSAATRGNLSVPYPACTSPEPGGACSVTPWSAVCDYASGEIAWSSINATLSNMPIVRATLRNLTGSSPLCTTGTYQVEATVRATMDVCGANEDELCTLVDQELLLPITANGRDLDGEARVDLAGANLSYKSVEVLSARVLEPSGVVIGAAGVTDVLALAKPRISINGDRLKIQATFPLPFFALTLDPTLGDGLVVSLTDRNSAVFAVTIPPERWQVQPPIGKRYDYKDRGGILNGVRKARISRILDGQQVTGYKLQLEAKGADLSGADFPGVTLNVALAGTPSGVFQAQAHRTCRVKGAKMDCR